MVAHDGINRLIYFSDQLPTLIKYFIYMTILLLNLLQVSLALFHLVDLYVEHLLFIYKLNGKILIPIYFNNEK